MDEEHVRALLKDLKATIDAHRKEQKISAGRLLLIEGSFEMLYQHFLEQQINKDSTQRNDESN